MHVKGLRVGIQHIEVRLMSEMKCPFCDGTGETAMGGVCAECAGTGTAKKENIDAVATPDPDTLGN